MRATVGVVGAGSWGTTLARILGDNGHHTLLWCFEEDVCREVNEAHRNSRYTKETELPGCVEATTDLGAVCRECDFMLAVVPSHVFRNVARTMGDHVRGDQIVVHCTKGIEQGTGARMSTILREETCLRKIGVLSGPNLSGELLARQPAGTLVASPFEEVVRAAQQTLHCGYFRVYGGSDVVGAETGGAFKNIIAVAAGVVDGLGLGENTKALLLTRGLSEMARYGAAMGAQVMTFGGMAGIGDLMATCASPLSRNHQVGERLGRGETLEQIQASMFMVAEGVKTARAVHESPVGRSLDLPIVSAVYSVLYEGVAPATALHDLMARRVGREFADLPT